MKRAILCLTLLCSLAAYAISVGYTAGSLAVSLSGVSATGAGAVFALPLNPQGQLPSRYTWQSLIASGPATSISVNFECSLDGTNFNTADTSTNVNGEARNLNGPVCRFVRCNVTSYTTNGSNETCQFVASF